MISAPPGASCGLLLRTEGGQRADEATLRMMTGFARGGGPAAAVTPRRDHREERARTARSSSSWSTTPVTYRRASSRFELPFFVVVRGVSQPIDDLRSVKSTTRWSLTKSDSSQTIRSRCLPLKVIGCSHGSPSSEAGCGSRVGWGDRPSPLRSPACAVQIHIRLRSSLRPPDRAAPSRPLKTRLTGSAAAGRVDRRRSTRDEYSGRSIGQAATS